MAKSTRVLTKKERHAKNAQEKLRCAICLSFSAELLKLKRTPRHALHFGRIVAVKPELHVARREPGRHEGQHEHGRGRGEGLRYKLERTKD